MSGKREGSRIGTGLVVGLVVALVACLAAGAWLVKRYDDRSDELATARQQVRVHDREEQARREALKAAGAFVAEVTTYSYERGEHDFDWVEELGNPEVRKRYQPVVEDLQRVIRQNRTSAKGEVVDSAARVVDQTQVEVLAFVDQAITDPSGEVSVEQSSITLTMKLVAGTWRVDELRFLNALGRE